MINKNRDILENLGQELEKNARAPLSEFRIDQNTAMPAELRNWLVSLRLLNGVPFANLVADSELLPQESIRWFYMDRRWTDALVQGALSVGTVNSDDRIQLDAQYSAIRAELDTEERNVRRRTLAPRLTGQTGPITGFLLRSAAVSGWPGMHVRAFDVDPEEGDEARSKRTIPDESGCCVWKGWLPPFCSACLMVSPKLFTWRNRARVSSLASNTRITVTNAQQR